MKKRDVLIIISLVITITLVIGAYNYTGFSTYTRGNCIDSDNTSLYISDDDDDPSLYIKGTIRYENRNTIYEDYCVRKAQVKEYYCTHSSILKSKRLSCVNGCKDGACIE